MPNGLKSIAESEGCESLPSGQLRQESDEQIVVLRNRVAILKADARLLLERLERSEISPTVARTEVKRLWLEVDEAERRVRNWENLHP